MSLQCARVCSTCLHTVSSTRSIPRSIILNSGCRGRLRDAPFYIRRGGARELGSRQFLYLSLLLRQFFSSPPWWDKIYILTTLIKGVRHGPWQFKKIQGWAWQIIFFTLVGATNYLVCSKNSLARSLISNGASLSDDDWWSQIIVFEFIFKSKINMNEYIQVKFPD